MNRAASFFSAFFLSVEQVHITFSRQAIQETWTTFFFLSGVLLSILYLKRDRPGYLMLGGLAFGFGTASKFHALPPLAVCMGMVFYDSWKRRSAAKGIFAFACLAILPATVYLLTYMPWFGRGYGLLDWVEMQKVLLIKMLSHRGNPMDQVIDTEAWQWFLRPMGYANFAYHEGTPYVTVAFSNPFVWLLVLPSAAFMIRHVIMLRKKMDEESRGIIFLLLLFIVSYLPLAVSSRPIWLLSSLAVIPFGFMIVSLAVSRWVKAFVWGKKALIGYLIAVLLSSSALYPMAVGKGKSYSYPGNIVERFRPEHEEMNGPIR